MTGKIIENYVKQYETDLNELNQLELDIEKLKNRIDDNFLYFYKFNYPDCIKALEKYFKIKITRLRHTKYIYRYDSDAWCNCIVIENDKAETILIDMMHSYTWETIKSNENIISIDNITDKYTKHVLTKISHRYPYEKKEIYDKVSCI